MAALVGFAVALIVLAVAPAASADEGVKAGALEGFVSGDPFALDFAYAETDAGPTGGELRVVTELGVARPVRTTRLRQAGKAVTATVVTGDPGRHRLALRVAPAGDGVIRVTARVLGSASGVRGVEASFSTNRDEIFTGFGERSNAVDFRGLDVLNYVADGPYLPRDRAIPKAVTPPWGVRDRDDDTYYPVPWVLSSSGYGVLVDNDETSRFDLGRRRRDRWSLAVESRSLSFRVFAGPRPADAVRRFTAATGRQPAAAASWVYGPWFQTGQPNVIPMEEEARIIRTLRAADAPASAMETQMHFLPCGAHRGLAGYERRRTRQAHAAGLAQLAYFNPHLCRSYRPVFDEAAAAGLLQRDAATGAPFTYPTFVGGGGAAGFTVEQLAQFDFTAPGTEAFYERLVREAFTQGKDGWMEDFGEYTPPFVASADGTPPERIHNRYPRDYHCTVHRIARRLGRPVTRHQRSGWTGAARCASIVWGGDPTTVWGFDGLRSAVTQALTIGISGVARWGSDIGGYTTFGTDERLTRELLHRWIEFGAVSAVMRTKRSGIAIPGYERPQVFDRASLPIWRRYAKLHTQLYPYLRGADAGYRSRGMPIMRHGLLTHPGDERAARAHDQFLFGPDLLAAPVTRPTARRQRLYAPAGTWVDWWRSVSFRRPDGAFVPRRVRLLRGGRAHVLPAPEDELPLLVRAGAVLPLLPAEVDTLSPYDGRGVVSLRERAGQLTLLAFPRGRWSGRIGARGRLRSRERRGRWTLRITANRPCMYTLRAGLAALRRPFRPRRIVVGGRRLTRAQWRYEPRTRVLTARFHAPGRATVTVLGAGYLLRLPFPLARSAARSASRIRWSASAKSESSRSSRPRSERSSRSCCFASSATSSVAAMPYASRRASSSSAGRVSVTSSTRSA